MEFAFEIGIGTRPPTEGDGIPESDEIPRASFEFRIVCARSAPISKSCPTNMSKVYDPLKIRSLVSLHESRNKFFDLEFFPSMSKRSLVSPLSRELEINNTFHRLPDSVLSS